MVHSGQLNTKPQYPACFNILDGFTHLTEHQSPVPGDVTVCMYCNATLEFTDAMQLIPVTAEHLCQVDFPELQLARKVSRLAHDIRIRNLNKKNPK